MNFFNLSDLNIKLIDFIVLLSPLGVVKKIVSNSESHLFEIYFHEKIDIENGSISINKDNLMDNTEIGLFYDNNLGFIINDSCCILQISNSIKTKDLDKVTTGKNLRKSIPVISQKILRYGLNLSKKKITNPESINIINFEGFQKVNL